MSDRLALESCFERDLFASRWLMAPMDWRQAKSYKS